MFPWLFCFISSKAQFAKFCREHLQAQIWKYRPKSSVIHGLKQQHKRLIFAKTGVYILGQFVTAHTSRRSFSTVTWEGRLAPTLTQAACVAEYRAVDWLTFVASRLFGDSSFCSLLRDALIDFALITDRVGGKNRQITSKTHKRPESKLNSFNKRANQSIIEDKKLGIQLTNHQGKPRRPDICIFLSTL